MRAYALALASIATIGSVAMGGCDLYWDHSGGDDTMICPGDGGGGDGGGGAPVIQRDPNTGACVPQVQYTCGCGDPCSPPAEIITGTCSGPCEDLDESDCLMSSGCHAAYADELTPAGSGVTVQTFLSCWDITPLTPLEGGECSANDAYDCAQHDDCVSVLDNGEFATCAGKPDADPGCAALDCGSGYECGVSCAGGSCIEACVATGQIGTCEGDGSGVSCNLAGPTCPAGTTPGVFDNCWSGYCIPDDECGSTCMSYTTAQTCIANNCTAEYQGSDCTCYSNGTCDCASETFESCD
jgi:hypothetical protein